MATALAPGLSRKVKKILETKIDSQELLTSLATLSEVHQTNTPSTRRRLRATLEQHGLDNAHEFLQDAEGVVDALAAVKAQLDGLSSACDGISAGIDASKVATAGLISETTALRRKLEESERRTELVDEFLSSYQLSESEIDLLTNGDVGEEFFVALERVRQIHMNCRSLLHGSHQRAGLEIMDAMGSHQESAYEKLCRWVQAECRALGSDDAPDVDDVLQKASHALQQRPVLFKYCAEEVATSRHNALFQRFIAALTRGGLGGTPRPIEMHAHDPRRYVGDMLAWVHQSVASEHELLVTLFGWPDRENGEVYDEPASTDMLATPMLLDRVFESICRPLKVRVEQVLMSSPPLLLCFRLSHLLAFYKSTMLHFLDDDSQLVGTITGCKEMASRIFHEQLKARGDQLQRYPPAPQGDLTPPAQVNEAVRQLLQIIETYETGVEQTTEEAARSELDRILADGLEPLLSMCEKSSEALSSDAPSRVDEDSHLDPSAQHVYMINCLHSIQMLLGRKSFMEHWNARLSEQMEARIAALVGGELGRILNRVGMSEIVDRMRIYQEGESNMGQMATEEALSIEKVSEALKSLFTLVSELDTLPDFKLLQAPRVRADAAARVARLVSESYASVYSSLANPASGYVSDGNISGYVKHTPSQVATILGVS